MNAIKNTLHNRKTVIFTLLFSLAMAGLVMAYASLGDILAVNDSRTIIKTFLKCVFGNGLTYAVWLALSLLNLILITFPQITDFLFKFRYAIAAGVFIICVALGISGSSAGYWCNLYGVEDQNLLLGLSREIRSDEFCVATPSFFAQSVSGADNAYSYFSDVINGTTSDLFYGVRQPIAELVTAFRPFLLGYLFLPAENALAFFWCGKEILLFLASLELGLLLTRRRKGLSFLFALLVSFAPTVCWWFSTSIADLIIYTGFSMALWGRYLTEKKTWLRILMLLGILWCAGCFIMTLYPAWQIPFALIILALAVWLLVTNWKKRSLRWWDILAILAGLGGLAAVFVYTMHRSADTIQTIAATAYPGDRFETGGGEGAGLFTYGVDLLFAVTDKGFGTNICESAGFIDFFPACLILPAGLLIREKKKDLLTILLLALDVFLLFWTICGFPDWLAKITLLSNCQAFRIRQMIGFLNLLLLFRSLALLTKPIRQGISAAVCGASMAAACVISYMTSVEDYEEVLGRGLYLAMLVVIYLILGLALFLLVKKAGAYTEETGACTEENGVGEASLAGEKTPVGEATLAGEKPLAGEKTSAKYFALMVTALIVMVGGIMVNPVRRGMSSVYEIEWVSEINRTADEAGRNEVWAIENTDAPAVPNSEVGLWAGVKTLNCTAVYPNLELWHRIDPEGAYEEIYNRYAHINLLLKAEGDAEFELNEVDTFTVHLTLDELYELGVTYLTSLTDVGQYADTATSCTLTRVNDSDSVYIYRLEACTD